MRKLAIAALSFSAAIFLSCYLLSVNVLPVLAGIFALSGFILISLKRKWLRAFIISAFALSLGFLCFFVKYSRSMQIARAIDGQTMELSGIIQDYPRDGGNYISFLVSIEDERIPEMKAVIYHGGYVDELPEPGDRVSFTAKLKPSDTKYGRAYFGLSSKNIMLTGSSKEELIIEKGDFSLKLLPVMANKALSQLAERVFPGDTAHFMKSLLLGDKADFYEDRELYADMSRAGLMHIVAISGMHIAFLVGFIKLISGGGRKSSFLCLTVLWFFVFVTGCGPSAVRAGIMQSLLLLAPIFERENDPATSLSAALAIILLINPFAAASISLQLSFSAMAGLLMFGERINSFMLAKVQNEKLKKLLRTPAAAAASSIAAMAFTLPLTAVHFGYVSLYSVLSNVLAFWAVSLSFCGGIICCILGAVFLPAGRVLALIISWPVKYIIFIADLIAGLPLSVVYMDSPYGKIWLIFTYLIFILLLHSKLRDSIRILLPAALSSAMLITAFNVTAFLYSDTGGVITALDIGQGQCISIISGDYTVLYDCGGMGQLGNAGDKAAAYLISRGREKVDLLILSHVQKDHANGVPALMELCDVERIIVPAYDYSDNEYFEDIARAAEESGTEIEFIQEDTGLDMGSLSLMLYCPEASEDINDSSICLKASIGEYDMLASGDASSAVERRLMEGHAFGDVELLIAGHHGSKYSSCEDYLEYVDADTAIISCGYNSYGHPAQETLERLSDCGYNIFRTDLNGSVEIRIGKDYGN